MMWVRRALGPIAIAWLVSQAAAFALGPVLLDVSLADCICSHDAEGICPMHHKTAAASKVCVMQSATMDVPAALTVLLSVVGPLPSPPLSKVPAAADHAGVIEKAFQTERPAPPDPPPPRA